MLQDRRAGDGDRYAPAPEDELLGWYGCQPHVNGVLRPYHDVARTPLSAARCSMRPMRAPIGSRFAATTAPPLPFVSSAPTADCSSAAFAASELLLSPAERVDVLVDFAGIAAGGFVVLETRAFDPMQAVAARSGQ